MIYGNLGVLKEEGKFYICQCSKCGAVDRYNKYALQNGNIKQCRHCKKFNGIEIGRVNENKLKVKGHREGEKGIEVLVQCLKCSNEFFVTKEEFKAGIGCKACKTKKLISPKSQLKKLVNEDTPEVEEKQINNTEEQEKVVENTKKQKEEQIKELEEQYNKKGLLTKDYTGQVINGMQIIEQSIYKGSHICKCKCTCCGEKKIDKLALVLDGKILCDNCKDQPYRFECPKCSQKLSRQTQYIGGVLKENNIFRISRAKLYSGDTLRCPTCGNTINLVEEAYKSDLVDTQKILLETLDTEKYGEYEKINQATGLAVSSKLAYIGRDGEVRKNCLCLTHKKAICLTDKQIKDYNHELCDNNFIKAVPLMKRVETKNKKKTGEDNCFYY